eukprot:m.129531 g.129531  ORF g.129531 m.129531 type:complete len:217 (+) comp37983_c0_seq5:1946-2596(+)
MTQVTYTLCRLFPVCLLPTGSQMQEGGQSSARIAFLFRQMLSPCRIIVGLTQYTRKSHIARATLEAVCFQTREIVEAMNKDSKCPSNQLLVDGGMTVNSLLLQLQADLLGIKIVRASTAETTALGVAMAAARGVGLDPSRPKSGQGEVFISRINSEARDRRYSRWKLAVQKSMHWVDKTEEKEKPKTGGFGRRKTVAVVAVLSVAAAILFAAIRNK